MLNQLVGLMGALPVHQEDSPLTTFKRLVHGDCIQLSNIPVWYGKSGLLVHCASKCWRPAADGWTAVQIVMLFTL